MYNMNLFMSNFTYVDIKIKYCLSGCDDKKYSVKMWGFKNLGAFHVIPLVWQQEETARINQSFTGAERKAALCELLEKEIQIIASIGRHRYIADRENKEALVQTFLNKVSEVTII